MENTENKILLENTKRPNSRSDYIGKTFVIFIGLPLIGWLIFVLTGLDLNPFSHIEKNMINGQVATGFKFNIISLWYLQIPAFIYYTRLRVIDAGLNQWLTIIFILPLLNLIMWFYPSKKAL